MEENTKKALEPLAQLLPDVYKDLAHPGMQALGKAIGNVIRTCTLPFAALGTLNDMAEGKLAYNLGKYIKKLEKTEVEKITEVPPELGVPVIQKLSYTTNEEIAELFINLLATASNVDTIDKAHPAFENIISQLSPDEARIINYLSNHSDIEYTTVRGYKNSSKTYNILFEKATMIPQNAKIDYKNNIQVYFANLIRLGILVDNLENYLVDSQVYKEIEKEYKFSQYGSFIPNPFEKILMHYGYFSVTEFGRLFINTCTNTNYNNKVRLVPLN